MACSRPDVSAVSAIACVEIKVQVVLQFEVCWGRSAVLLSQYGLNYQSEVVAEFGPLRGPRRRAREARWLGQSRRRVFMKMASPRTHLCWKRRRRDATHKSRPARPRRRDREARIIPRTRPLTVFSVSFHVSILSSNGPLKAEKDMAWVVVMCSSRSAIYLRGTDAVATRSLQTRRPSYDHEDCVEVK